MSLKKLSNNTTYRGASLHCVKSVQIWSFSGPYFPVFGLNAEIYPVNPRIQSKYGKIRTKKTPYLDKFYAVLKSLSFLGELIYKNILETWLTALHDKVTGLHLENSKF